MSGEEAPSLTDSLQPQLSCADSLLLWGGRCLPGCWKGPQYIDFMMFFSILSQKQTPFHGVTELRESCAVGRERSVL